MFGFTLIAALLGRPLGVFAAPALADITGSVVSATGTLLGGARIEAHPGGFATRSAADGTFRLKRVPEGTYTLVVSKPGFAPQRYEEITVGAQGAAVAATLTPSSFSSLSVIGRTSAGTDRSPINTSASAISIVPGSQFLEQGQVQLTRVLDEVPGVITTTNDDGGQNGASANSAQTIQIRGALPYETASLIDGHPVSVGADGSFSPLLVNPALLQDVEIVKGPGGLASEINYAIGGSINYRTLQPSAVPRQTATLSIDRYGGVDAAFQATGTTLDRKLGYALAYATDGIPGPLQNYAIAGSQVTLAEGVPPWTIDGQPLAGSPIVVGKPAAPPQYAGIVGEASFADPLYLCCSTLSTAYDSRGELAKMVLNLTAQTSLELSYLGGQSEGSLTGSRGEAYGAIPFSSFAPPAGYAGSVPAGTIIPFDTLAETNLNEAQQQNLFQGEFRTTLGATTLLGRVYSGFTNDVISNYPLGSTLTFTANTWGGIALCPAGSAPAAGKCATAGVNVAPSIVYFNGSPATYSTSDAGSEVLTTDHVRGYSVELSGLVGRALLTGSIDQSTHDSSQYAYSSTDALDGYTLPPGSSQEFTTVLGRVAMPLAPRVDATLSNYVISYRSHYTGDGGATWNTAVHAFDAPRLGLSWRAGPDVNVRASLGSSIAPPYISLLSSPGGTPVSNAPGGATYYLQNQNNGQIAPETAFGYDVGTDVRVRARTTLSADAYLTLLRNLFLQQTYQAGTYTPPSGADAGNTEPLYVTQTANLGHALYEGIELALHSDPTAGVGYRVQGSLLRAYPYALPAGFYSTAGGPLTANLGVINGVNFQPSGVGYNGLSNGRVPYAQGYAELNYTSKRLHGLVGLTYYGANNSYNHPAFAVLSAALRIPISDAAWLQIAADNLTGAYDQPYAAAFAGVPVPLVNGQLGATTGANVGPTTLLVSIQQRH